MIFDEMMKYLEVIFMNSNHLAKIKREFTALIMKQTDNFHQFFIKFQHMIEEIEIIEKNFKYELNSHLFYNIHIVVIEAYIKNKDFKKFVDVILQITDSHKEIYEWCQKEIVTKKKIAEINDPENRSDSSASTSHRIPAISNLSANKCKILMINEKCFICKQTEHCANVCPNKLIALFKRDINKIEKIDKLHDESGKAQF